MSLMKTLAKVAVGVAIAKGMQKMSQGGANSAKGGAGTGGLFGGTHSPDRGDAQAGTPLEGMMDSILGGGSTASASGGLGGMLDQLGGRSGEGGASGLNDLLEQLGGGGLGGMLGGLTGALQGGGSQSGSFGEVLASQFDTTPETAKPATAGQEAAAGLMLSAMLQAAKSDGKFDRAEQEKIVAQLGNVGPDERRFVEDELGKPVDVVGLAKRVPEGLETQVYMMSVLGIDLDQQQEARYLHDLSTELGINTQTVNQIHDQLGVPRIYG